MSRYSDVGEPPELGALLLPECRWDERTADGRTWRDMPGTFDDLKKLHYCLYRRMSPRTRLRYWRWYDRRHGGSRPATPAISA